MSKPQMHQRDVAVVFTETTEEAVARAILDSEDGKLRLVVPVVGEWGPHYALIARGRRVFVATPNDNPGELTAKKWGDDAWRAGATDVQRERPKGHRTWVEILSNERNSTPSAPAVSVRMATPRFQLPDHG